MNHEKLLDKLTLDQLLDFLDEVDREILILWWLHGYTFKEISSIVTVKCIENGEKPVSSRTVGNRIHKIMEKLREIAKSKGT